MSNQNLTNREVCDLIFVDYSTRKPFLNLDFANVTTTELTGESVFAYGGKGHPKRVQFAGERGGTLTIETQIQTVKLWQLITGGETSKSAKFVTRVETNVDEAGTAITLADMPVAGSVAVYAYDDDCGTELACTVADKAVTLATALSGGAKVVVYYMKEVREGAENQHQVHEFPEELHRVRRHGHEDRGRRNPSVQANRLQGGTAGQPVTLLLQHGRPGQRHDHVRFAV